MACVNTMSVFRYMNSVVMWIINDGNNLFIVSKSKKTFSRNYVVFLRSIRLIFWFRKKHILVVLQCLCIKFSVYQLQKIPILKILLQSKGNNTSKATSGYLCKASLHFAHYVRLKLKQRRTLTKRKEWEHI